MSNNEKCICFDRQSCQSIWFTTDSIFSDNSGKYQPRPTFITRPLFSVRLITNVEWRLDKAISVTKTANFVELNVESISFTIKLSLSLPKILTNCITVLYTVRYEFIVSTTTDCDNHKTTKLAKTGSAISCILVYTLLHVTYQFIKLRTKVPWVAFASVDHRHQSPPQSQSTLARFHGRAGPPGSSTCESPHQPDETLHPRQRMLEKFSKM